MQQKQPNKFADLRQRAEELLQQQPEELAQLPAETVQTLIHELQVYQAELEIQNEELRQIQQQLEISRDKYADLYDFAPVGYFTVGERGLITEANLTGAALLGVDRSELIKQPFSKFVATDNADAFYLYRKRLFETQTRLTCELEMVKQDGTRFNARLESITVSESKGEAGSFRTAVIDITERKRAEAALQEYSERLEELVEERTKALQEAQKRLVRQEKLAMLGQLAGGIAHNLRQPLGGIKNVAYFLNIALESPEPDVQEALKILGKEVAKSEHIITSLLTFARTRSPIYGKVNLNNLVKNILAGIALPEQVEITCQLDETLPDIQADPDQLEQVFDNLISNALQAMPEGGQLTLCTNIEAPAASDGQQFAVISITDTGQGIPADKVAKIFEPLFTTRATGIGLGLALVKHLVEGHGGGIKVESEPGRGSTFTVRLPVRDMK